MIWNIIDISPLSPYSNSSRSNICWNKIYYWNCKMHV